MESNQAYPCFNFDPEPHVHQRYQETPVQNKDNMGSYQAYPSFNIDPEPHARQRIQETTLQNKLCRREAPPHSLLPFRDMAADKNGNPVPGTLVEHEGTYPFENDLYLCSQMAIQGTARPTHYHMLLDEAEVPANNFQDIVEPPPFQANLSGSMSSWTPYRITNDSLPFQTPDSPGSRYAGSRYDEMGFGPEFQPHEIDLQPMWLPSADAVAPMPQVDYEKVEALWMAATCKELIVYCKERGIKTSRTRTRDEFVKLALPVLPGVDCWALSKVALRERCKAHNVALPPDTQYDSKAVMARKLTEDDAKCGLWWWRG